MGGKGQKGKSSHAAGCGGGVFRPGGGRGNSKGSMGSPRGGSCGGKQGTKEDHSSRVGVLLDVLEQVLRATLCTDSIRFVTDIYSQNLNLLFCRLFTQVLQPSSVSGTFVL